MSFVVYRELYKWWAQYVHSRGDLKEAISYYEKANDILALAKIYCGLNKVQKASPLCFDTGSSALFLFLILSQQQLFCILLLSACDFWATVCKMVRRMPCPVLSVCNVAVLWPNGWMDHETWHTGRLRS